MNVVVQNIKTICTAPEGINLIVVKVETTEPGLYGLGCATFSYRHSAVKLLVEAYLKPLLIGKNVGDIEEAWQLMHQNAYWRNGPIENNAISGIDMALWDIKGKLSGKPLYDLFGGKCRKGVPVYRHADGNDASEIYENILKFREQGITHVRCQCGGYGGKWSDGPLNAPRGAIAGAYLDPRKYIRDTADLFESIRVKAGRSVELIHDVHGRIAASDAIELAKTLEPYNLFFLEDILPLEQIDWLPRLRSRTSIPLALGELFNNPAEWRLLVSDHLIDFIRIHNTQLGGITPTRKLQILAENFGVRTAWHGPGDMSPLGHAANIHLDIASRNFGIQEWSGTEPPNFILHDLKGPKDALLDVFSGMPEFKDGYVYANDKPGLGIDIDEREAAKYPCDDAVVKWTQTRLPDGSLHTP
ncbi:MAG: 2-dehydro-3-deoxy-6-phosphogalactonate aldolase [Treponema sp. GWB1_62_6]|nr:MAG: 2-dehydro-3-deoxy-6-phosphogalactonate aldolase [Treponema sp. GWA1_62_8]OHE63234.1 MAG: 2-dehydro-3-deoxy-6-phosphogalactonate aldolase [Treponema sp. GWB1_62_6]OHE69926.1 MAG: 2-dehydro-3-deoxy-6-phosphogalactonate aldolase [Treponema sp. GWC1_61_84]OHE70554.1 MAG: 2-dehydro-3-deoxy-6-phosphogalactonate aldolase [Treponema sp. RIFOXYC1_FULL_61_9]HCM28063.1 starvation-sensing protein RspA [Treponema sp.]